MIHRPGQEPRETPTHTLTLPLQVEPWQAAELDKVFEAARLLYNSLVTHFNKQYKLYQNSRQYKISTQILEDKQSTKAQKVRARKILAQTKGYYGFTQSRFEATSAKLCGGWLKGELYSMVRQRVAANCLAAFKALLNGKGKIVKYKGFHDKEATLRNKHNQGPFRYDNGFFICNKLTLPVKFNKKDSYVAECMTHRIKFCGLSRRVIRGKVKYYLILYLEGTAPDKVTENGGLKYPISPGAKVGIDIGSQTVVLSSRNGVRGEVLAAEIGDVQVMQNKISWLNRAMDRSRRASNPWAFGADGQVIPIDKVPDEHKNRYGKRNWKVSNHYKKLQVKRKELSRKQAAIRKQSHWLTIHRILVLGTEVHVEKMNWAGLAKRAKGLTKKSKKTGRYISKKRFGKSIANRAPAMLIEMLRLKVEALGGVLYQSNAFKIKASQVDHQTRKYAKKALDERYHTLQDGTKVQRDYYSAFIEEHVDEETNTVDFNACNRDFPEFYKMYQADIARLAAYKGYLPKSFGIEQ